TEVSKSALRKQDRVFVVVTIPSHERNAHVLTQCQLTAISRWTISQDITTTYFIAQVHKNFLVDTSVLVRTGVLDQVVDIYTCFTCDHFVFIHTNNNTRCINKLDTTSTLSDHTYT